MSKVLNKREVRAWLAGQNAATARTKSERTSFLISLTPERSLQIYLALKTVHTQEQRQTPSPLLWAMRQAVARLNEHKRVHESPEGSL